MAGYASQTDYEADLLQTYLRKGRVSPITKRDVNLALSIYRMPKAKTDYKNLKTLTADTARKAAKGKSDTQLMRMATVAVLNKNIADRKASAAAKKQAAAANQMARASAQSLTAPRTVRAVPPTPQPVAAPRVTSRTTVQSPLVRRRRVTGSGGTRII